MLEKVNVPMLGLVENMSYFTAPNGERIDIFGHGGGKIEAERQNMTFLGEIPIYTEIRIGGDQGVPVVVSNPQATYSQGFTRIAASLRQKLP
jgi:ATP-binding protein involved in chromosome partitioning